MKDAIASILKGKLNTFEFIKEFSHEKPATVLKTEKVNQISYRGVANLIHLSSVLEPGLDIDLPFSDRLAVSCREAEDQKQKPDRKETGRA